MSVNEWNATHQIEGIRSGYLITRESLQAGCIVTALSSLELLQNQTEALHENYLNLLRNQLLVLEPLLQHINLLLAKFAAVAPDLGKRGGQAPGCKEENADAGKQ